MGLWPRDAIYFEDSARRREKRKAYGISPKGSLVNSNISDFRAKNGCGWGCTPQQHQKNDGISSKIIIFAPLF